MLLKTAMAYQLQIYMSVGYLFSQPVIFLSQQWPILFFAQDIVSLMVYDKIVKKWLNFDLYIQMLRNCLACFSQNSQIRNWCINWWELHQISSLIYTCSFSVYFCFACQICGHAQFYGKIKTNASRLLIVSQIVKFRN